MLRWLRRLPAYAVNGASVSVGIGAVQGVTLLCAGPAFARAASVGAVLASLPHLTSRAGPTFRRTLSGGLLASLATLLVLLTAEHLLLRGVVIGALVFLALLGQAWGSRAGAIVFSVIIGVVFALARPSSNGASSIAMAHACGVALYALWGWVSAKLLSPRYRTLSVFSSLEAAAALLSARAAVISQVEHEAEAEDGSAARFVQLNEEVRLAQALQAARDLVYPEAGRSGGGLQVALISRIAELREIVLTSRLDLELLGHDHPARYVRARLALGLRRLSAELRLLAACQRDGTAPLPSQSELPDLLEAKNLLRDDVRARLLPVTAARLRYLHEEVQAIGALLSGENPRVSLRPDELEHFVVDDDTWPLHALRDHLSLASPVLRHALRSALAMTCVYALSHLLPWATRPYWLLLSVAVVLRGTLDDTLSRRDARVLGTAIGCVAVTVLVPLVGNPWLELVFIGAVGVSHAFVNVRYLLTAASATVMALLQAHFVAPTTAALVVERLLDTVLGALFAWGFSYVLPSWERRTLPAAVERALSALRSYSQSALALEDREQRLARQQAYDALAVVAAALQRSAAEPARVRPPIKELVSALDHAQRLMAHLSSVRSLIQRRGQRLPTSEANSALAQAKRVIAEQLQPTYGAGNVRAPGVDPLELPNAPAEQEPLPWLLRRLDASVHDAREAGLAARSALQHMRSNLREERVASE